MPLSGRRVVLPIFRPGQVCGRWARVCAALARLACLGASKHDPLWVTSERAPPVIAVAVDVRGPWTLAPGSWPPADVTHPPFNTSRRHPCKQPWGTLGEGPSVRSVLSVLGGFLPIGPQGPRCAAASIATAMSKPRASQPAVSWVSAAADSLALSGLHARYG